MIVITSPTGAIGRPILAQVLASGESIRVIARDPALGSITQSSASTTFRQWCEEILKPAVLR